MHEVNYVGVVIASVASFAVGWLWYGVLFKKKWKDLMGFTDERMKSMRMTPLKAMSMGFVATVLMVFVLAQFMYIAEQATLSSFTFVSALRFSFWIWLGFQVTVVINQYLYEDRPFVLFLINASYQLVALLVASAVLSLW